MLWQGDEVRVASLDFKALAERNSLAAVGEDCSFDRDCVSHRCEWDEELHRSCEPAGLETGAACSDDDSCTSRLCIQDQCASASLPAGSACLDHRQCQSNLCQTECVEEVLEQGAHCTQPVQCISHVCENKACG